MGHPPFKCWRRLDAKCSKCNQLGHEAVIYKSKLQQPKANAQVVEQDEDHIFAATCFSMASNSECWLIDSNCTNHMTYDKSAFKDLKPIDVLKIKIGNGDYIQAKGKGTISISTSSGAKLISDVLYVLEIDQNLLSVGQLLEKGFKLFFEHKHCLICDIADRNVLRVKMRNISFSFDPTNEEYAAYYTQVSPTKLWHKRLGHFLLERMLDMKKRTWQKAYQNFLIIYQIVMLVNLVNKSENHSQNQLGESLKSCS